MAGLQSEINLCNEAIKAVNERLPDMNGRKQLAASSRNFKEASAISKEIKAAEEAKETQVVKVKGLEVHAPSCHTCRKIRLRLRVAPAATVLLLLRLRLRLRLAAGGWRRAAGGCGCCLSPLACQ